MNPLSDFWRRGPIYRYFADMEPIDRVTALVVLALLSAFVISYGALMTMRTPTVSSQPQLTAPPFIMDFAGAGARVPT